MHLDLPPPTIVENARGLSRLVADLEQQRDIAVDTEADSFFSYHEKVCLIQITVEDRDYLVDPLAKIDLEPLGKVLADPKKQKVFHDGEYDILLMKRRYGFSFKNLFDTRVAAATLGSKNPGLASVLRDRFKIELDKSMQRSNWGERPLSDKQIRYARLDTHFLLPLMKQQKEELESRGRAMIVAGECRRLEQILPPAADFDPDEWVNVKGARLLAPTERQIFRELFILREKLARAEDQAPFRVMNQESLLALARARPRHVGDLQKVNGFSWKQVRKFGDQVIDGIARGIELGPLRTFPATKTKDGTGGFTDEDVELHERLKELRKKIATREDMESAYLLNRHLLLRLTRERPTDRAALERLEGIGGIEPWQVDMFGREILDAIAQFETERRSGTLHLKKRRRPWRGS
jgi:ribonuclease D